MAETTPERDLILSIHPQHVANIVNRVKNHEFRNYLLPVSVKRLWIYETSPASSIRYVATISHGKRPGEIRDPKGLRNDEFDRGDLEGRVKYAYEILKLEELPEPYSLTALKSNGWLGGAPQKYCFVKPAMATALNTTSLRLVFDSVPSVTLERALGVVKLNQSRYLRPHSGVHRRMDLPEAFTNRNLPVSLDTPVGGSKHPQPLVWNQSLDLLERN